MYKAPRYNAAPTLLLAGRISSMPSATKASLDTRTSGPLVICGTHSAELDLILEEEREVRELIWTRVFKISKIFPHMTKTEISANNLANMLTRSNRMNL